MSNWTPSKTIRHGSCTVIIHRPELTHTERAKREQAAKETLERVMREYLNRKDQAKQNPKK